MFFDETKVLTININRKLDLIYSIKGEPFDKSFRLSITLDVDKYFGSHIDSRPCLTIPDKLKDWKCSLFIINYVRVYKRVNRYENSSKSSYDISADKMLCS
jgi:hypothetical protein